MNYYLTTGTPAPRACAHESSNATRLAGDPVASAWECVECGHLRPFTEEDYAFCNTYAWVAPSQRVFARLR